MTPEQREELKPCPFCGAKMELPTHDDKLARGAGLLYVSCDCGAMGASGKNRPEAINAWNRRAQVEALTVPQDDLRDAAQNLIDVLDGYSETLVPINRNSVTVKRLRSLLSVPAIPGTKEGA